MTPDAHWPPTPRFVFDDGQAYESMMGQWSALVAEPFLDWLALPEDLAWLDDGCGNGSFTEVLVSRQRTLSVIGVDPSPAQLAFARQRAGAARVGFVLGDAEELPLPDASVDVAVMALVLFFLPEPGHGLRELARVVRTGGTIAAYHWDIAGGGFPLEPIVEAVRAEGYQTHRPPSTWAASLEASENLWRSAGLVDVQTCQIRVRRSFDSFEEFWRTAYGSPRLRELFNSISPTALQRLSDRVCDGLKVTQGAPLVLEARANAVKGRRPGLAVGPPF